MKKSIVLSVCVVAVNAFPSSLFNLLDKRVAETGGVAAPKSNFKRFISEPVGFDAASQYVSNTGDYAFVAPLPTDARGPCPGLNAMANHGYLPHNGVANIPQFIEGTNKVFGMGLDLAGFLAVYGSVFDGNLESWSIGGPVAGLTNGGGLLGEPYGISGSHNKYEGDVSPTRGDLYQYGNDYKVQLTQFQALYDLGKADDNYDLDLLFNYRITRFQESLNENPYFFNAPFSGIIASPAAWSFIYRFMANKSEEYPAGQLNGEVLKSFYSITGDDGDFTYTPGYERIPDNWYTRNIADPYSIPFFAADAVEMAVKAPQFASLGGNTNGPTTFVGIDPANITSGVINADNLLEGNNFLCFALELTTQEAPDILSGLFTDVNAAMDKLGAAINNATNSLGCPQLNNMNRAQFGEYPGYTQLKPDGTY